MQELKEFCHNHPKRLAKGRCALCWFYFCTDCLSEINGYRCCKDCVKEAKTKISFKNLEKSEEKVKKKPLVSLGLKILLVLTVLALIADIFYFKHGIIAGYISSYQTLQRPKSQGAFLKNFKKRETKHFIIYYHNEELADFVEEEAEADFEKIVSDLLVYEADVMRRGKFSIEIVKNDEEYQKLIPGALPHYGALTDYETKSIVIVEERKSSKLHVTLPHEITHAIFFEVMNSGRRIPQWIHEGLASYEEAKFDDFRVASRWFAYGSHLAGGGHIPLSELKIDDGSSTEEAELFYTQSTSVVSFLIEEYGMNKFMNFCKTLQQGENIDNAIKKIYSPSITSLSDLEQEWLSYIRG